MLEEALAIYRELGDRRGEGNILWGLGSYHYFTADAGEPPSTGTASPWSSTARPATGRWKRGRCTCLRCRRSGTATSASADETGAHALRHFHEAGRRVGRDPDPRRPRVDRAWPTGDAARAGRLCGAPRGTSSRRRGPAWPTTSSRRTSSSVSRRPRTSCRPRTSTRLGAEGARDGARRDRGVRSRARIGVRRRRTWRSRRDESCQPTRPTAPPIDRSTTDAPSEPSTPPR